ncbi:protein FAM83F-like isoform X2 [Pristis pectinata]|uniref:protein FAM83F-like isoform X2 n=1 Tax=Pristis pectinata TaxID=685728 RepID=UPI00223E4413|nr:protein FAM83F-like isoform X2 [Pristis pectinata]
MADSQLMCLDDNHINISINDKNPQFFYCESQRLALEELLESKAVDFNKIIKKQGLKEFLSSKEVKKISKNWDKYKVEKTDSPQGKAAESDDSLTYWPEQSDIPIPELDLGWTEHVAYRGITRATIYMQPPRNSEPFIKEVVRKLIQEARKVLAVVMDDFTDQNIFEDLVEAGYRHRVAVYIVLDQGNLTYFLEMCRRMELKELQIRNIRVRSIAGTGLYLTAGHVKGTLNEKFMIVDGDKALSGSYSFTWSCARLHRSSLTLFTGQILEAFDAEFRELYANSDAVNLPDQLGISPGFSRHVSSLVPPRSIEMQRKFHNPKYLLAMEGLRRAASDNQLSPAAEDKAPGPGRNLTRDRRGTLRESRKENDGKGNQAVHDWLIANDVRGLDQPEPLEDLVPPHKMPNGGKVGGSRFRLSDLGKAISRRDNPEPASGSPAPEGPSGLIPSKSTKSKRKKEEAEVQDKVSADAA